MRCLKHSLILFISILPGISKAQSGYRESTLAVFVPHHTTDTLRIEKRCPWSVDEYMDNGKLPPDPVTTLRFPVERIQPLSATDSTLELKADINGRSVECTMKRGKIRITRPVDYYRGSDAIPDHSNSAPHYEHGIVQFDLRVNGKKIRVPLDYVVHPHIKSIIFMVDATSKMLFVYIPCGDGAGTAQLLLVIKNSNLTGHYDWEYGYDVWKPRDGLDAFQFRKRDRCQIYSIAF